MTKKLKALLAILIVAALGASPALAQGTGGSIEGRLVDEQGLAVPGATITAKNIGTGFSRSSVSDSTGAYSINGLTIGEYEVRAEMTGFSPISRKVGVNVGTTTQVEFKLSVGQTEEITVTGDAPLIDKNDTGVGVVISQAQITNLPLNGRQFANLAALVPGVSLGIHTDPTKSTQLAPQINGGGGRNINYLIDGGDNNDDTVGGLVQAFPLDSIGEFKVETQRFRAETGRSVGGTMKVVTKSGTNELRGSAFEFFRDKSLNSRTESEKLSGVEKGDYRRHQFGASLGGPIVKDRTHFFLAVEKTSQKTTQAVDTLGLFPDKDGVFDTPVTERIAVGKITHQVNPSNYLSLRYGFNDQTLTYGASPQAPPENWGLSQNKFHSANLNLNSNLGGGRLNEFVFQFSYFLNTIKENSTLPYQLFPNGVVIGQSVNTPQTTNQKKYQFRDDFSFSSGRHDFKIGASFIYSPVLDITFSSGRSPQFTRLADSLTAPISNITFNGSIGGGSGGNVGKIPNNQYGAYIQDTWRASDKLTLDLGLRYDLVTGFAFDQTGNIIFREMQAAAQAGLFSGNSSVCPCIGLEDFGKESAEDKNNFQPRLGFTYDVNGDGKLLFRGGVGRYTDFAYTNANVLFAVVGAQSSFGTVYQVNDTAGIKNPDGSFFNVGDPLPANQLSATAPPLPSHVATPRIKQPYSDQANFGFSKDLGNGFALDVNGIWVRMKDLGVRPTLNVRIDGGSRRFASILPQSGSASWRVDLSKGRAHYKAVNLGVKKRGTKFSIDAWYSLSKASSSTSLRATDEFGDYQILNAFDPFQDRQEGPVWRDARHRVTISPIWSPGNGLTVSASFRAYSKFPRNVLTGTDDNRDGLTTNDLPAGVETYNAFRGSGFSQLDMRVAKRFALGPKAGFQLIAEGFNLFNAKNPAASSFVQAQTASNFGQPTLFAGDFQQGEQRLAQFGIRFDF